MPQSLAQLYTHLIFSTKNRQPTIGKTIWDELSAYLGGTLRELKSPAIAIGVVPEHVHILYRHAKTLSVSDLLEKLKVSSSKWMKTKGRDYEDFYWQNGYGAFSVSASRLEAVKRYVLNQEEHHREVSFQDEFRGFLREYRVEYDERYVWD